MSQFLVKVFAILSLTQLNSIYFSVNSSLIFTWLILGLHSLKSGWCSTNSVLALAYDAAILLLRKTFLKSYARWSAVAMCKLCWTITFVTITSSFKTLFLKTSTVSPLYKEGKQVCFLQEASACLWEGLLECSFTSFKPWWWQVKFFPQGRQWNLYLSCFTSVIRYDAFHSFLNETLYIFEPVNFFFEIAVAVAVLSFLSFDLFSLELSSCVCFNTILYNNRHAQFNQNIQWRIFCKCINSNINLKISSINQKTFQINHTKIKQDVRKPMK